MAGSITGAVAASGETVGEDELVNFGSQARSVVDPSTGSRSYWFRYGDIKHLTLQQVQAAGIGNLARAGRPGGADYMRVSQTPVDQYVRISNVNFAGVDEYTMDAPVPVRISIEVSS